MKTREKSTWRRYLKGLDKLERRPVLKEMYDMCHWEFLNLELQGTNLNDPENPMMQVAPGLCSDADDIRQFLLECAKENLPGARENLKKVNSFLGIRSSKVSSTFERAGQSGYSPYHGGKPDATYYAGWFVDNKTPWVFTETEISTGKITVLGAFATEAEANQFGDNYKTKGSSYGYEVDNVLNGSDFDDLHAESLSSSSSINSIKKVIPPQETEFQPDGSNPFNDQSFYYYFRQWVDQKLHDDNPNLSRDEFSMYDDHVLDDYSEDAWYDEDNPPTTMKSAAEELWQLNGEDIVNRLNSMFGTHFKTRLNSSKEKNIRALIIKSARVVPGRGNYYIWIQRPEEAEPYWLSGDAMAAHRTEDLKTAVEYEGLKPWAPEEVPSLVSDEEVPVESKLYDGHYNYVGTIQEVFPEIVPTNPDKYWLLDTFDRKRAYTDLTKDELIEKIKESLPVLENETDEYWVLNPHWDTMGSDADTVRWGHMGQGNENGGSTESWGEVYPLLYPIDSLKRSNTKNPTKSSTGSRTISSGVNIQELSKQLKLPSGVQTITYDPDVSEYAFWMQGTKPDIPEVPEGDESEWIHEISWDEYLESLVERADSLDEALNMYHLDIKNIHKPTKTKKAPSSYMQGVLYYGVEILEERGYQVDMAELDRFSDAHPAFMYEQYRKSKDDRAGAQVLADFYMKNNPLPELKPITLDRFEELKNEVYGNPGKEIEFEGWKLKDVPIYGIHNVEAVGPDGENVSGRNMKGLLFHMGYGVVGSSLRKVNNLTNNLSEESMKKPIKSSIDTDGKIFTEDEWVSYVKANEGRFKTSDIGAGWEHDSQAYLTTKERFLKATSERGDDMTPEELYENYDELPIKEFICYDNGGADEWVTGYDSLEEAARALYRNAYRTLITDPDLLESLGEFLGRDLFEGDELTNSSKRTKYKEKNLKSMKNPIKSSVEGAILKAVQERVDDLYPGKGLKAIKVVDIGNSDGCSDEDITDDPEMCVEPTILFDLNGQQDEVYLGNDAGEWEYLYTLTDNYPELEGVNSSKRGSKKNPIKSARGEVTDSIRQLVRDILDQVPALVKVPAKQQGIRKEPYGPDHVCYFYTESGPRPGSFVTVEFHVDPTDLYTHVFVTTRASFAVALRDGRATQDEREIALTDFVIEDLEDYSLADVDRIDTAVTEAFEGAIAFDKKVTSSLARRKAIFSSRKRQ